MAIRAGNTEATDQAQLPKARHRAKISKEIGKRAKQVSGVVFVSVVVAAVAKQHVRLCPQRLSKNNLHACLPESEGRRRKGRNVKINYRDGMQ